MSTPDSFIALLARLFDIYVVKYTASAAETWARSKGATEAEIEAARLCLKATPMQTARITTAALARE